MNQSINTDSKNSKEPQQKYRLGTVSIKILGGLKPPINKSINNQFSTSLCCSVPFLLHLLIKFYLKKKEEEKRKITLNGFRDNEFNLKLNFRVVKVNIIFTIYLTIII